MAAASHDLPTFLVLPLRISSPLSNRYDPEMPRLIDQGINYAPFQVLMAIDAEKKSSISFVTVRTISSISSGVTV